MSSLTLQELIDKWQENFRKARAELEAKAAAGDVKAKYLLAELDGKPVKQRVDSPIPGPHWQEREPGEDAE